MDSQLQYMDNSDWNDIDGLLAEFDDDQLHFSAWSDQVLDLNETIINAVPLSQRYPLDPLSDSGDLFNEFNIIFDGLGAEIDTIAAVDQNKELKEKRRNEKKISVNKKGSNKEEKVLTFEQVSKYFYMPITQAAKELNMGLTLLKKKCRELGIPRWPHRKMKSLQTLIKNIQELEREQGEAGEEELQNTRELLEQEKKLMERDPGIKMEEKTKRLRQACFKANYKKRRLQSQIVSEAAADVNDYIYGGVGQCFY